ncbi:MAG: single-stranded DNA-binding protein [Bacteroidetes bacterium GWA2_31_9b]|nr:MAG: single-stranded DNA-binding protein [Bacteroidetes bacterium GWA2_31_9b]
MMGINKVILVGNVGKDPEIKHLDKGVSVARFSLATSETYKDKDNKKVTNTEWHNIVLWRGLAEVAEKYVKKGSPLYIEGKIRSRTWDDKDGKKHYATEIVADTMQLLGSKQSSDDNVPVTENMQNEDNHSIQSEEDDLPF